MKTAHGVVTRVNFYSSKLFFFDVLQQQQQHQQPAREDDVEKIDGVLLSCALRCGDVYGGKALTPIDVHRLCSTLSVGDCVGLNYEAAECSDGVKVSDFLYIERGSALKQASLIDVASRICSSITQKKRGVPGRSNVASSLTRQCRSPLANSCKYWINSRRCPLAQCAQAHPTGEEWKKARVEWHAARLARRADAAVQRSLRIAEPADGEDVKYPKKQRARLLCDWIMERVHALNNLSNTSTASLVLDVAGGKGDVSAALADRGLRSIIVDPRRTETASRLKLPQIEECFGEDFLDNPAHREMLKDVALLVGLHPDQATEAIVDFALKQRIPFVIVPCCVFVRELGIHRRLVKSSSKQSGRERTTLEEELVVTYEQFLDYLQRKHHRIRRDFLQFRGRNVVLSIFDYEDRPNV